MTVRQLTEEEIPPMLERYAGHKADHKPCEECGLYPLYFKTDTSDAVRVDGCFGGYLTSVWNACCGHGGRGRAYVRIGVENGRGECVDICGGKVSNYADYYPPKEQT